MNRALRSAFAATAVVVVVACGPAAVAPVSVAPSVADVPPTTAASPTASPTAAPSPTSDLLDTSTWTTYVSKRHGFSIAHPADWSEDPSDHEWTIARDATNHVNTGAEHFSTGGPVDGQGVGVSVWSVPVDPGTTVESWLPGYCNANGIDVVDCLRFLDRSAPATMDGHAGSLTTFDDDPHALFLVDGRIYVIACWRPDDDPSVSMYGGSRRLVEGFLSTMRLLPGGPAPSSTTPAPS